MPLYLLVLRRLVLLRRLSTPASMLRLHLPLLGPGLGRRGSCLRPVVARLLRQELHSTAALCGSQSWVDHVHVWGHLGAFSPEEKMLTAHLWEARAYFIPILAVDVICPAHGCIY